MSLTSKTKILFLFLMIICLSLGLLVYGEAGFTTDDSLILWELRFPKILVAFLAGGMLATSGLLLQIFFQNPLAGPDLLGINSGSSLGVAFAIMGSSLIPIQFQSLSLSFMSLLGALAVIFFLTFIIQKKISKVSLIILGLLIASFTSSTVSLLVNFSTSLQVKNFLSWSMGTFRDVTLESLPLFCFLSLMGIMSLFFIPKKLNQYMLGENYAITMGMNVRAFKSILILICSLQVAVVTSFCGPIAFIGVIAPHLARSLMKKSDVRVVLPSVFFIGSLLALFTEWVMILLPGHFLGTNALLGLIGAPVIGYYLIKNQKKEFV